MKYRKSGLNPNYKKLIKSAHDPVFSAIVIHNQLVELVCENNAKIDKEICRSGHWNYLGNIGASRLWDKRASHYIKRSEYLMKMDCEVVRLQKYYTDKEVNRLKGLDK